MTKKVMTWICAFNKEGGIFISRYFKPEDIKKMIDKSNAFFITKIKTDNLKQVQKEARELYKKLNLLDSDKTAEEEKEFKKKNQEECEGWWADR